ncbi:YeiH family protein [Mahella australiensis]|uniref:Uncharacterized protein family UPF0324 n=1 Tax=Mahella australiensis (strain DSM 15567 / CIP 107919 / 50-1 BON) TaxID=697281 RepID=F3ZZ64_MAHA5|nr:YeiH family protein [Mahella australiensis]AEE97846.1 Uncharacterized protein family UPF0324 [Mahella australiensis 50-1 BON]
MSNSTNIKTNTHDGASKYIGMLPGILIVILIAIPSRFINSLYPPLSDVIVAIILGMVIGNAFKLPRMLIPGIRFSAKTVLKLGIILLGVSLNFFDVLKVGAASIWIIVACITLALLLTLYLGKRFHIPAKLAALIGVGTSICGTTAIVATAPAIDADEQDISFAVATITVFGILAIFIYPIVGDLLDLSQKTFGMWAGTAINETSQVVAAGFLYGEQAGEMATVVKLTRTIFLAPVMLIMAFSFRKSKGETASRNVNIVAAFPWFILGFLAMALLNTWGVFSTEWTGMIKTVSKFLIVMAMAGVGLNTDFKGIRAMGFKAFYLGLGAAIIMAATSLALIKLGGL